MENDLIRKPEKKRLAITIDDDVLAFVRGMAGDERITLSTWINSYFSAMMRQAAEDRAAAAESKAKR